MGLVETLKDEFDFEEEWIPYQLRPELPPEGVPYSKLFPDMDPEKRQSYFDDIGKPYGLTFCKNNLISNSRLALEAAEYAREQNKFKLFHNAVFKAYFTDCKDIGNYEIIKIIAQNIELDVDGLKSALDNKTYAPELEQARSQALQMNINAVPTFIINTERIVGIQKRDIYVAALQRTQK
jgi:predicted DsbA family dithiol-disulfide isomerase